MLTPDNKAEVQKKGQWTTLTQVCDGYGIMHYFHKECKGPNKSELFRSPHPYCPNCGDDMRDPGLGIQGYAPPTGLQPLKHVLGRIREIAYGGGLTNARKISVDTLRSHIDLAIKFANEIEQDE